MRITIRQKQLSDKRISLYLDIYNMGKRRYEFLNLYLTKDKEQNKEIKKLAEQIRSKRELDLANSSFGFIPEFNRKISLIKYFDKFVENTEKYSNLRSSLIHLKDYVNGNDIKFSEVDVKFLSGFKEYLVKQVSNNSANTYFAILKRVFRKAYRENIISRDITANVDNIKMKPRIREFLELGDVVKLSNTDCKIHEVKRAFLFACFTGLRFSDLTSLQWKSIKADNLELRQKKTNESVYIPLAETAKKIIFDNVDSKLLQHPENKVFNLPCKKYYNDILKLWFKEAKIQKNASSHVARHTFAVLNITAGNAIYTVSKLMGHRNLRNTEIYSRLIDEKKKEAIDKLPVIEVIL
jgi:site-specific recombinase XerD